MSVHIGNASDDDTVEIGPTPAERRGSLRRVAERPVFVDASGRRQRRVRRIGRVLVVPAVAYVGLLVSTVVGGPTVNLPFLPLPPAPHAQGTGHGTAHGHGGSSAHGGSGTGTTGGTGTGTGTGSGSGTGGSTAGTGATAGTGGTSAPTPGTSATPGASATPTPVITHGKSTHTAVPPGASHHPTKKARATAP